MTTKRVVVRTHSLMRYVASAILLKKYLEYTKEPYQIKVNITNSANHNKVVKYWRPHLTVMNVSSKIESTRAMCPETKIIFLNNLDADSIPFNVSLEKSFSLLSRILVSCEKISQEYIVKYGKHIGNKSVIVGDNRFDLVKYHMTTKRRSCLENSIGFVGNFFNINQHSWRPVVTSCVSDRSVASLMEQMNQFHAMYKSMRHLIESTDYLVSLRPHPYESIQGYEFLKREFRNKIEIDSSLDTAQWMCKQKVLIGVSMINVVEASLLQIPYIDITSLATTQRDERNQSTICSNVNKITALNELIPVIENAEFQQDERLTKILQTDYGFFEKEFATERIGKIILEELSETHDHKFFVPLPAVKGYCFLRYIRNGLGNRLNFDYNYLPVFHSHPRYIDDFAKSIFLARHGSELNV